MASTLLSFEQTLPKCRQNPSGKLRSNCQPPRAQRYFVGLLGLTSTGDVTPNAFHTMTRLSSLYTKNGLLRETQNIICVQQGAEIANFVHYVVV
jgi:hypothetical protein